MPGKISTERLKGLLYDDLVSVSLTGGGGTVKIEPTLYLSMPDGQLYAKDVTATLEADGQTAKLENFGELVDFLARSGYGEGEFELEEIGSGTTSLAEWDADRAFDKITMAELLEKYSNADEFELVCKSDVEHLTAAEGERALAEAENRARQMAFDAYRSMDERERAALPDFETLFKQVTDECEAFREANAEKIERRDGHACFVDEFACGRAQYKSPMALWHVYSAVDYMCMCRYRVRRAKSTDDAVKRTDALDDLPQLKAALLEAKPTYTWHCTTTSSPMLLMRFKLTRGAREWFLGHRDDYSLSGGFEDLALYADGKILFSSCTHERFHTDLTK